MPARPQQPMQPMAPQMPQQPGMVQGPVDDSQKFMIDAQRLLPAVQERN